MIGYGNSFFINTVLDSSGSGGNPPVNTVAPVISGNTTLGSLLSSTTGTWTGTAPITYSYQWKRNGNDIVGANSSLYTIQVADSGAALTCQVTATNIVGSAAATSNTITANTFVAPTNTVAPVISGTQVVGSSLSSTTGTWTGTPLINYTYQWYRGATLISGATSSSYTLVQADAGNTSNITCQVTATNAIGSATATSNTLAQIFDFDANAFITAASITDNTQKSATNSLTIDLKGYNIWTKFKAIYPIVGGSASSHAVNLKTPGTFNLTFASGWTHSANGMTPTNAYADSSLNVLSNLSQNSTHISVYIRTNNASNAAAIAASRTYSPSLNLFPNFSGSSYFRVNSNADGGFSTGASHLGLWVANRISSTETRNYRNTTRYVNSTSSTGLINQNVWLASSPDFTDYYINQFSFASIGDGLSDTEAANFYTAVQAYQTTLSRQV